MTRMEVFLVPLPIEAPGVVISILIPIPEIGKPISFNCLRGKLTLQPNVLVKIIINDRLDKCRGKTEQEITIRICV